MQSAVVRQVDRLQAARVAAIDRFYNRVNLSAGDVQLIGRLLQFLASQIQRRALVEKRRLRGNHRIDQRLSA
jgi:hypothetical protein